MRPALVAALIAGLLGATAAADPDCGSSRLKGENLRRGLVERYVPRSPAVTPALWLKEEEGAWRKEIVTLSEKGTLALLLDRDRVRDRALTKEWEDSYRRKGDPEDREVWANVRNEITVDRTNLLDRDTELRCLFRAAGGLLDADGWPASSSLKRGVDFDVRVPGS